MGHPSFRCHDNKNLCRNDDPFHYTALICVLDNVCSPQFPIAQVGQA